MNARTLRWAASKALVFAAPALKRATNFYGSGVALEDAAERQICSDDRLYEEPLRPDQAAFVRDRCQSDEDRYRESCWKGPWRFSIEHFELRAPEFLGHTGRLIDRERRGVVTEWGGAEGINRDKVAALRMIEPVDGVAIPVAGSRNYFHFLVDAALPLISYFESGAALSGPHVVLSGPNPSAFAQTTLAALCAHYGAELRFVTRGEKVRCAAAVAYRRRCPARDWFPAPRPAATRLREILLEHFGRTADPNAARRVYLRRGPEKLRNLLNHEEVTELALARNYEVLEPAASNFADQVRLCAEADTIFAVHGAALANILFARPNTKIIELFAANQCKSVYIALSRQLGQTHTAVLGGESRVNQNFAAHPEPLTAAL